MIIKINYEINKKFIMKQNREKIILQKQNKRCKHFRDLVKSYVELENRSKALEEKLKLNDSEKH